MGTNLKIELMNSLLDTIWEKIAAGTIAVADGFDALLSPFHFLGPAMMIFLLAVLTVFITKSLNRIIVTKRYIRLGKEFKHWYNLRQTALTCEDREKGKALAKNIDQAELNKAYYDYFFEGLLLGLARKIIPILFIFAYINEYFQPKRLVERFGQSYIFKFGSAGGEPVVIGTVFWYILSLLSVYLLWYIIKKGYGRYKKADPLTTEPASEQTLG
jgi:uncharacterized membrane protein (DUF106 family)